ncbi:hypothetical protein Poli38472_000541 [Pythium oligandrum]|uniref:Fibronectin type-III domain-containing protein n=1 Tax=Pythium oligandrum TaxID=41045 RepID=A0A8K1CCH3_PYTOL|nr:hypothetical protein Poli38472_000541 [Pythium oligandrum]|eukprot:TMW60499.1 hypothetical protein Poli38472_000541 [Pythium oligandrum]
MRTIWSIGVAVCTGVVCASADASCVLEGASAYVNCFDATGASENPCGGCQFQINTTQSRYESFAGAFRAISVTAGTSCEPAMPWICPGSSQGKCCVVKEQYALSSTQRRLCGNEETQVGAQRVDEQGIHSWLAGEPLYVSVPNQIGTQFYVRGKWSASLRQAVGLVVPSKPSETRYIIFNWNQGQASWAASLDNSSPVLSMEQLPTARVSDSFELRIEFEWLQWKVILNSAVLFVIDTTVYPSLVEQFTAHSLTCVSALGIQHETTSQCVPDVYESVFLSSATSAFDAKSCCEECSRVDGCTRCSYQNSNCFLLRDAHYNGDTVSSPLISSTNRLIYKTISGCECKSTYLDAIGAVATCFTLDDTRDYRCMIDSTKACTATPQDPTWDRCHTISVSILTALTRTAGTADPLLISLLDDRMGIIHQANFSHGLTAGAQSVFTMVLRDRSNVSFVSLSPGAELETASFGLDTWQTSEIQLQVQKGSPRVFYAARDVSLSFVQAGNGRLSRIVYAPLEAMIDVQDSTQCLFNSTGRCGYHNDMETSSSVRFLDDGDLLDSAVTALSRKSLHESRILSSREFTETVVTGFTASSNALSKRILTAASELPHQVLQTVRNVDAILPLIDAIEMLSATIRETRGAEDVSLWSVELFWDTSCPLSRTMIPGCSSMVDVVGGEHHQLWRLVGPRPLLSFQFQRDFVGNATVRLRFRLKAQDEMLSFQGNISVVVNDPPQSIEVPNGLIVSRPSASVAVLSDYITRHAPDMVVIGCSDSVRVMIEDVVLPSTSLDDATTAYTLESCGPIAEKCNIVIETTNCESVRVEIRPTIEIATSGDLIQSHSKVSFGLYWLHLSEDLDISPVLSRHDVHIPLNLALAQVASTLNTTNLRISLISVKLKGFRLQSLQLGDQIERCGDSASLLCQVSVNVTQPPQRVDCIVSITEAFDAGDASGQSNAQGKMVVGFNDPAYPAQHFSVTVDLEPKLRSAMIVHRRLSDTDTSSELLVSSSTPTSYVDLWDIRLATLKGAALTVSLTNLLSTSSVVGFNSMQCRTKVSVFQQPSQLRGVYASSDGTSKLFDGVTSQALIHPCNDTLVLSRIAGSVDDIPLLVEVMAMSNEPDAVVAAVLTVPVTWTVFAVPSASIVRVLPIGSTDIALGSTVRVKLEGETIPWNARVEMTLGQCSDLVTASSVAYHDRNLASQVTGCNFVLQEEQSGKTLQLPVEVQLAHVSEVAGIVSVQLTTTIVNQDPTYSSIATSVATSSMEFRFCETVPLGESMFYLPERDGVIDMLSFITSVFSAAKVNARELRTVAFLWSVPSAQTSVFRMQDGNIVPSTIYNATADGIFFDVRAVPKVFFSNIQSQSVLFDVITGWQEKETLSKGCFFRSNIRFNLIPRSDEALEVAPYVYSRKVYAGSPLDLFIPVGMDSSSVTRVVKIRVNDSTQVAVVERDNVAINATSSTDPAYIITAANDSTWSSGESHLIVRVIPVSDFIGSLRFGFELTVGAMESMLVALQQYSVERTSVYYLDIEWIPTNFTAIKPVSGGAAIYRSAVMRWTGETSISFRFRVGSVFSHLSADVILNGTDRRAMWTSEGLDVVPFEWQDGHILIALVYPSLAEVVFYGEPASGDSVSLDAIAIEGSSGSSNEAALQWVSSTGGMIKVRVDSLAQGIEPLFYRVYAKALGTTTSKLVYGGNGLEPLGCFSSGGLYSIPNIASRNLVQCHRACVSTEAQIAFTATSVVRSVASVELDVTKGFTIESWVRFEGNDVGSSGDQVIFLFGDDVTRSVLISYNNVFKIKRCTESVLIPHQLPANRWTHVTLSFQASGQVDMYLNGNSAASVSLGGCAPSASLLSAHIQLGRDALQVLSSSSTTFFRGAMDEFRMWNRSRQASEIRSSFDVIAVTPVSCLVVLLRFNTVSIGSNIISGSDSSGSDTNFFIDNVNMLRSRSIQMFGQSGDGRCYCGQSKRLHWGLPGSTCNKHCDFPPGDGSDGLWTCGSSESTNVLSVYSHNELSIGNLFPKTSYEFRLEIVASSGQAYDVKSRLIATTMSAATVPGQVPSVGMIGYSESSLEIAWQKVIDTGGQPVLKYEVFLNGFLVVSTMDGSTLSAFTDQVSVDVNSSVVVRAVNDIGAGPGREIKLRPDLSFPSPTVAPVIVPLTVRGGAVVFTVRYPSGNINIVDTFVEQRELSQSSFVLSQSDFNATSAEVMVLKLLHDSTYFFRSYSVNKDGQRGDNSFPIMVKTRARDSPDPTPLPNVVNVTGGSIVLLLLEPLYTGGQPFSTFNIFMAQSGSFKKLTSVPMSTGNSTFARIYRDADGNFLLPQATYSFKVLALQAGHVCEVLKETDARVSGSIDVTTTEAHVPPQPQQPILLQVQACTATIAFVAPEDFGGTSPTRFRVWFSGNGSASQQLENDIAQSTFKLTGILCNTSYSVTTTMVTSLGETSPSLPLVFASGAPGVPSPLQEAHMTNIRSSSGTLEWTAPRETGGGNISSYLVYQSTSSSLTPRELIYNGTSQSTQLQITKLLAETEYFFSIVAINQYGIQSADNIVRAVTTGPSLPSSPRNLLVPQVFGGLALSTFQAPLDTGGFQLTTLSYFARARYLVDCFSSVNSCTGCLYRLGSLSNGLGASGGQNTQGCAPTVCPNDASTTCCFDGTTRCSVLNSVEVVCGINVFGCAINGLNASTEYLVEVIAQNTMGNSSASESVFVKTSTPTIPDAPILALSNSSGGSISLQWQYPLNSGGARITRISLSANGVSLLDSTDATSYTYCQGVVAKTSYAFILEVENSAGLVNRTTRVFTSLAASGPGVPDVLIGVVGPTSANVAVKVPCDTGGGDSDLQYFYEIRATSNSDEVVQQSYFSCCSSVIPSLSPSTEYVVGVRAENSEGSSSFKLATFTTTSGILPSPRTELRYSSTEMILELIVPDIPVNGDLRIDVTVTKASDGSPVSSQFVDCPILGGHYDCPPTIFVGDLEATQATNAYTIAVRAAGYAGTSEWTSDTYHTDTGIAGTMRVISTFIWIKEGESGVVEIGRLYGTTVTESVTFQITDDTDLISSWYCDASGEDSMCNPTVNGAGVGSVAFYPGEYNKRIRVRTPDDTKYQSSAFKITVTLTGATQSSLGTSTQSVIEVHDNGDAGNVGFTSSEINVNEADGAVYVDIARNRGVFGQISVLATASLSSAVPNGIFKQLVVFADTVATATLRIPLVINTEYLQRSFKVQLTEATGGANISDAFSILVNVNDRGDISLPGSPDLDVLLVTGGSIHLSWTEPAFVGGDTSVDEFQIWVRSVTGVYSQVQRFDGNTGVISNLTSNSAYTLQVAAINPRGLGAYSEPLEVVMTDTSIPTIVRDLQISAMTGGAAKMVWQVPADSGGVPIARYQFRVYDTVLGSDRVVYVDGQAVSATIGGLVAERQYQFSIRPENSAGLVGPQATVTEQTFSASPPALPPAPRLLFATGGSMSFSVLQPIDCGGTDLLSYTVKYGRITGSAVEYTSLPSISIQDQPIQDGVLGNATIFGLLASSTYYVRVSIESYAGASNWSPQVGFATSGPTLVSGVPKPAIIFEDPGELTLGWSDPLDLGGVRVTGYLIESRKQQPDGTWTSPSIVYDGRKSVSRSTMLRNLDANTNYTFSVVVLNYRSQCSPDDANARSEELVLRTRDASVPSSPKRIGATSVSGGAITIEWSMPLSSGGEPILHYIVYGGVTTAPLVELGRVDVSLLRSFTLRGLTSMTEYKFVVCGANLRGPGVNSTEFIVSTSAPTAPEPPRNVHQRISFSGGKVLLTWDAPADSGGASVIGYDVYRNGSFQGMAEYTTMQMDYEDAQLVRASTYYNYTIFTRNTVFVASDPANIIVMSTVATIPASPAIHVIEVRAGFIDVGWSASADTGGVALNGFHAAVQREDHAGVVGVYEGELTRQVFYGLSAGTSYRVEVSTANEIGFSASQVAQVLTGPPEPPSQPPFVRLLNVYGGRISVEVTPPQDMGGVDLTDFFFFDRDKRLDAQRLVSSSFILYDVIGLLAMSSYSLRVAAANDAGVSPLSVELMVVTTDVSVPATAEQLSVVSKTHETITFDWQSPRDTGGATLLTYTVEVRDAQSNVPIDTIENAAKPLQVFNLAPATAYALRVRVLNSVGGGEWSDSIIVTTEPVSPGVMGFQSTTASVLEDASEFTVYVYRRQGGSLPASCQYHTEDGTAIAGEHYVSVNGTVIFASGVMGTTITIPITNNAVLDDPERTFLLHLVSISELDGSMDDNSTLIVTIQDDGDAGVVQFANASYAVSEAAGVATIGISRVNAFSSLVELQISALGVQGGAVEGVDFVLSQTSLILQDQQQQGSVDVRIFDDDTYQMRNTFGLQLSVVQGKAKVGAPILTFVEILDDGDASAPDIPTNLTASGVSGGMIRLTWARPLNRGAANISVLTYSISVSPDALTIPPWTLTSLTESATITQLTAQMLYQITVAASNGYYQSNASVPLVVRTASPSAPVPPSSVQVTARTGGSANITWLAPTDSGGSRIIRYRVVLSAIVGDFQVVKETSGLYLTLYGLRALTEYSGSVQAINADSLQSDPSNLVVFTTRSATVPSKPNTIVIRRVTGGVVEVEMQPPLDTGGSNITFYTLYATSAQFPTVFKQVYQGNSSIYLLNRLQYRTEYKLRFRLQNVVGASELSDDLSTTTSYLSLPTEPRKLAMVSRTAGTALLSWEPPVDFGGSDITKYQIMYFIGYDATLQYQLTITHLDSAAMTFTANVPRLQANTTYGFLVLALNDISACYAPSTYLNYSTVFTTTDTMKTPGIPEKLAVTTSTAGLQIITWSPPVDGGGDLNLTFALFSEANQVLYNGSATEFKRGGIRNNRTYSYYVVTQNAIGTSLSTRTVEFSTLTAMTIPAAPTGLTQTAASGGSISLAWSKPLDTGGDDGVIRYQVYRDGNLLISPDQLRVDTTFVDNNGIAANRVYEYAVRAVNVIGSGAISAPLTVHAGLPTVPNPPRALSVVAYGGRVELSWLAPLETGGISLTGFTVAVYSEAHSLLSQSSVASAPYVFYGVRAATMYNFSVSATNDLGPSATVSTIVTTGVPMKPGTPPQPELKTVSAGSATLTLLPPLDTGGTAVTGFSVFQNGINVLNVTASTSTEVSIPGLNAATTYLFTFRVNTAANLGESELSPAVTVTTTEATVPAAPYNPSVTKRLAYALTLSWNNPADTGGESITIDIEYSTSDGSVTAAETPTIDRSATTSSYELSGLTPVTTYSIRLRSKNTAGSSAWTDALSVQTDMNKRGVVTFSPLNVTVFENATSVTIQLVRQEGSGGAISCHYDVTSSTTVPNTVPAVAGRDYDVDTASARAFEFADSELQKEFSVQVYNNVVFDPLRLLEFTLYDTTSGRSESVVPITMTIFIADDDDGGWVEFENSLIEVSEAIGYLTIPLRRTGKTSSATRVGISSYLSNTTTAADAYRLESAELTIGDGETTQSLSVVITNNHVFDYPFLQFALHLSIISGGAKVGGNNVVTVVLLDDGDHSAPGLVGNPEVIATTGGMLTLSWVTPVNVGGMDAIIARYHVTMTNPDGSSETLLTPNNETTYRIGMRSSNTKYSFQVAANNTIGIGPASGKFEGTTTNVTMPGPPQNVTLVRATGGLLTVSIEPPVDLGGASIIGYLLYLLDDVSSDYLLAYNGSLNPLAEGNVPVPFADTDYQIKAQAVNIKGIGELSVPFTLSSSGKSMPSAPRLHSSSTHRTGGSIGISWDPPIDQGGYFKQLKYAFYARRHGENERFFRVNQDVAMTNATLYTLHADTAYDIIGVSIPDEYSGAITSGKVNVDGSSITTDSDVTYYLFYNSYFDFGGYLFQVDPNQPPTPSIVNYRISSFEDSGDTPVTMQVKGGAAIALSGCGPPRQILTLTTKLPTVPGEVTAPTLVRATGGALHVQLDAPLDTGGIPIRSYLVYVDDELVIDAFFYNKSMANDLQLEIIVQIGELEPETEYRVAYTALNDVSSCGDTRSALITPQTVSTTFSHVPYALFNTTEATLPVTIKTFWQMGATGGGINVAWEPPVDRGSSTSLLYKLYMSSRLETPREWDWQLVYNGTKTMFWVTKLKNATSYLFHIKSMNEVGDSDLSDDARFSTSEISAPGPPSKLSLINATGGLISFGWSPP